MTATKRNILINLLKISNLASLGHVCWRPFRTLGIFLYFSFPQCRWEEGRQERSLGWRTVLPLWPGSYFVSLLAKKKSTVFKSGTWPVKPFQQEQEPHQNTKWSFWCFQSHKHTSVPLKRGNTSGYLDSDLLYMAPHSFKDFGDTLFTIFFHKYTQNLLLNVAF